MKRSVLVVVVVLVAMLVTTASLSAQQGTIRFNDVVDLTGKQVTYPNACLPHPTLYLTGDLHVQTDLIEANLIDKNKLYEQHVNMQGVEGIQDLTRTFRLVGATKTEGIAYCNYLIKPVYCQFGTITEFTLVETSTQQAYPVTLKMGSRFDLEGDAGSYSISLGTTSDLCPQ